MAYRKGKSVIHLENAPSFVSWAAAVGKKEGEGPLNAAFDKVFTDEFCGEKTFEKAETHLQKTAVNRAVEKAGLRFEDFDIAMGGDLLNQCIGTSFSVRETGIALAGLYGACSTMAMSLALSAVLADGGAFKNLLCVASSHFCSAERQYRTPLEYGGQRSQAAQWTVTGAGAAVLTANGENTPYIPDVIIGRIVDLGIKDAANMGAAMAPAAADTIAAFLRDTDTKPEDYGMILTGDLGFTGSELLREVLKADSGIDISAVQNDCGMMIFDREKQDVHSGGSGCGCSAAVVCSHILNKIAAGELDNVLFVGTGALLSPTSSLQGESIPGIAHGVLLKGA